MINDQQHEVLQDIFCMTERTDKISIELEPVSRRMTVVYDGLDHEWFKEITDAAVDTAVNLPHNAPQ